MKLKSFGCSFILGEDLNDFYRDESTATCKPSLKTYPALLAQYLEYDYECYAEGGSGNLRILKNILNQVNCEPSFFVIQWSYIDRFDYIDLYDITMFNMPIDTWTTILPQHDTGLAQEYYKKYHSEYKDKISSLLYINTALQALKQHNHKFLMFYVDRLLLCDKWHTDMAIQYLQSQIKDHLKDFYGMPWHEWCLHKNFPIGPYNHPLEEAHQVTANKIIDWGWV